jgi:hypothetical protein
MLRASLGYALHNHKLGKTFTCVGMSSISDGLLSCFGAAMTIPPASIPLSDEEERFYGALGKAITQWQEVEQALAMLFLDAHTQDTWLRANVVFHSVLSFETRMDMVDAALKVSRSKAFLAKWEPLFKRCAKRAKRRNQLAHFTLSVDPNRRAGYRCHLRPSIFDASIRYRRKRPPELSGCQIIAVFDLLL